MEITCEVFTGSPYTRHPDTGTDLLAGKGTALDGLRVVWGRDTTADQPDMSTCAFEVLDREGPAGFLSTLHMGTPVQVFATGQVASTGATEGENVVVDGSFTRETSGGWADNRTVPEFHTGKYGSGVAPGPGLWAQPLNLADGLASATPTASAYVLPDHRSTDPTAWDRIPKVSPGQVWTWRTYVRAQPGMQIELAMGVVTNPNPAGVTRFGAFATHIGTNAWVRVSGTSTVGKGTPLAWPVLAVLNRTQTDITWSNVTTPYPIPSGMVGPWNGCAYTWDERDASVGVDTIELRPPPETTRRVLVFSGRVSDLALSHDEEGSRMAVTATDWPAALGNLYVGDEPWSMERADLRAQRILTLAHASAPGSPAVPITIASTLAALLLSWRDVDNASALGLLTEIAESIDGVLWSATHEQSGPYLYLEDPDQRVSLAVLTYSGGLWNITGNVRPADAVRLSACAVDVEPVRFEQDASEVVTRVDLTWLEQTLDDDGNQSPTERHVLRTDPTAEATYGVHRQGISTELTNATNAGAVADSVLARSRVVGWRLDGVQWDTRLSDVNAGQGALDVLDGTWRIGAPVVLSDLPSWAPTPETLPMYLEGGSYTYEGGSWLLDLTLSPSGAAGKSMTWAKVPITPSKPTWNTMAPTIDWLAMYGVGGI